MGNAFDHQRTHSHGEYRVFPELPESVVSTQEPLSWRNVGAWGCLVWMIIYFFGGFLFLTALLAVGLTDSPTARRMADWWILPSGILGFVAAIAAKLWRRARERRTREQEEGEAAHQAREAEADALTAELLKIRQSSRQLAAQLPQRLHDADGWLQSAEQRWNENVPDLFWEAVQNSTAHLVHCCANAQELAHSADRYYSVLRERRHTFPPFPLQPTELPNPMPIVQKLQGIVRLGQTRPSYATRWEQYKTHQISLHGFSTLEQAVSGLLEAAIGVTALLKNAITIDVNTDG